MQRHVVVRSALNVCVCSQYHQLFQNKTNIIKIKWRTVPSQNNNPERLSRETQDICIQTQEPVTLRYLATPLI